MSSDSPDSPVDFSDSLYFALCKDHNEPASQRGQQHFRDRVFEFCSQTTIALPNSRLHANGILTLCQLLRSGSFFPGLQRLDLHSNQIGNYGVFELMKTIAQAIPTLKYLNLGSNNIGNKGATELARFLSVAQSPSKSGLISLELGNFPASASTMTPVNYASQLPPSGAAASAAGLSSSHLGSFTALPSGSASSVSLLDSIVKSNHIDSKGASKLFYALQSPHSTLTYLGLKSNEIGSVRSSSSSTTAKDKKDEIIPKTPFSPSSATAAMTASGESKDISILYDSLTQMLLKNSSLTAINLESTAIGTRGAAIVLAAICNHNNQRTADVPGANAGANAGKSQSKGDSVRSSVFLPFAGQQRELIADPDRSNHNKTLRSLNLANNGIDSSIGPLLQSFFITNNTLLALKLSHNPLHDGSANANSANSAGSAANAANPNPLLAASKPKESAAIASSLPSCVDYICNGLKHNTMLLMLDLENTNLGDSGANSLAQILSYNQTLTSLNVSSNNITEAAGRNLALSLQKNPVLTALYLNQNPLKNAAILALAESLITNTSLQTLELNSCKISDDGVVALASSIGNNSSTVLKTMKLRDNYISSNVGEFLLDSLYRNRSLCSLDLRGNQLDHTKLGKLNGICKRNIQELKEAEPRKLKKEIARLRGEQMKLRQAENTLQHYRSSIDEVQKQIAALEKEKAAFAKVQQDRRAEIRAQIEKEKLAIAESQKKLEEKRQELSGIESSYQEKLADLNRMLQREIDSRKATEAELNDLRKQLEESLKEKPNRVQELKDAIEAVKTEKNHYQQQLIAIRKELANLQSQYESGAPIVPLIEQAKAMLLAYQTEQKERMTSQNQVIIDQAAKYVKPGVGDGLGVSVPPTPSAANGPSLTSPTAADSGSTLAPRPPAVSVAPSPRTGNSLKSPAASSRAKKSPAQKSSEDLKSPK